MKYFKRLLYLFYYIRETDYNQLRRFLNYAENQTGRPGIRLLVDSIVSTFRYNTSIKDYYCFRFFNLQDSERRKWAGTGFMYEYQLIMNPKGAREVLENKILFLNHFNSFIKRDFQSISEIEKDHGILERMLKNHSGRLVLKGSRGQVGAEVQVVQTNDFTTENLISFMHQRRYDLVEQYVIQHPVLMNISPTGLNTVRVFSQLHDGKVEIIGARLRVSVNSPVDNMAAGNLAAPVDLETGIVNGPGVYSDITKQDQSVHPVTQKPIEGLKIPHWDEVKEMVYSAHIRTPENKSVGWDIAVTADGPELIEGNHNWCKLLWQMPVKMGLKSQLENYL